MATTDLVFDLRATDELTLQRRIDQFRTAVEAAEGVVLDVERVDDPDMPAIARVTYRLGRTQRPTRTERIRAAALRSG